ncbi:MAG: DJ-1/PfpI family protein [Hyphomicrobiales bacterium]
MRTIGALIFPGFELLDLFGPLEMFGLLEKRYEIKLIANNIGPVKSNQGPSAFADMALNEVTDFDILFVPGGAGTRREVENEHLLAWLRQVAVNAEYVLSVCTGSALLARAGLLDGKRATTNKAAFGWAESQGPNVSWLKQARWVEDGKDMALKVANWAEYNWQQDPEHDPFAALNGLV